MCSGSSPKLGALSRSDIANCSFTADTDCGDAGVTNARMRILSLPQPDGTTPMLANHSDSPLPLPTFAGVMPWMPDQPL